jgi:hypothetical protein
MDLRALGPALNPLLVEREALTFSNLYALLLLTVALAAGVFFLTFGFRAKRP